MSAPDGGPALFRLVRFWSRRWSLAPTLQDRKLRHVQVLTAVAAAGPVATIAGAAHQLGIDRSGASRLVRDAVEAGLLTRRSDEDDGRRAAVAPTAEGRALLAAVLQWQRAAFIRITAGWDPADRDRFAGYLQRLADEQGA
ncbi:transcriptional regulator, MarR family [Pseudonocardia thermophila]|uniref:Transcriptional regulator, MarR family n=1 Tax=Pseudonocardia thermophila TaxID=1848 RepID=A0A1M6Y6A2_PSETH|nr:MarR family winged helix-turn-helix transcriptional regulator [Pseudonocardia thermophila]SHL13771.1 transcriptional regulator, MarR family [Pseudonocardia thermophila]